MTHADLVSRAAHWLRHARRCGVVLEEPSGAFGEIPDCLGWHGREVHLIECKVSRADFLADRRKVVRVHSWVYPLGTFRYFMAPAGLIGIDEVPARWGLLEVTPAKVRVRVKPKRWGRGDVLTGYTHVSELAILLAELRKVQIVQAGGSLMPTRAGRRVMEMVRGRSGSAPPGAGTRPGEGAEQETRP